MAIGTSLVSMSGAMLVADRAYIRLYLSYLIHIMWDETYVVKQRVLKKGSSENCFEDRIEDHITMFVHDYVCMYVVRMRMKYASR